MSDIAVPVATPVPAPAPVPAPVPVVADKGTGVVNDLMTPTTVRADIITALGVLGVVLGALGSRYHIPVIPDAILTAVSGLIVLGVQAVRNAVHGSVTKVALQNDAAFLVTALPQVQGEVTALKSSTAQIETLAATASAASADAADAKAKTDDLQAQMDALPAAQKDQIEAALRALLASVVPHVPVAPVDPVDPITVTPTAPVA